MRCPETVSPMSSWHLPLSYHHLRIKLFYGCNHHPDSLCKITGGVFELDDLSGASWQRAGAGACIYLFSVYKLHTGLRQMEAGKASVLAFAEPMVAAVAGIVVFGEMLRVENVLGILLIFTALVVLNSRKIKR